MTAVQLRIGAHRAPLQQQSSNSFNVLTCCTQSLSSTFQYARATKCRQLSCCCVVKVTCTNGRHFGRFGLRISVMCASCGSRVPLRVLHPMQEQTTFSHVVSPPRSRDGPCTGF